jgi:hypothetical protein
LNGGLLIAGVLTGIVGLLFFWVHLIGNGLMALGFILFILGIVLPSEQRQQPVIVNPPTPQHAPQPSSKPSEVLAIYPECKNRISSKANFCPVCGADLRPKK